MKVINRLRHHRAYHYAKVVLAVAAAILAVAVVTTVTVDLGPAARQAAEDLGRNAWQRPIHLGRLSIKLFGGHVVVDDFSIEGLKPEDRPFFTAKRIEVTLDWSTLIQWAHLRQPEITITGVEMVDWTMLTEKWESGTNFPKFTSDAPSAGPKRFTTTLKHLRAWRGQFTYEDHEAPWSIVARHIDLNIGNLPNYHGTATFTGGTVAIQDTVPFYANMNASYAIDGGNIHLDRIEFETDGARTIAAGDVDFTHWPEQKYEFKSRVQFARMRELFFKDEKWNLSGEGDFAGTFHLFKGGRDLSGTFTSPLFGINEYRFASLYGGLQWTPDFFDVRDAGAKMFGGDSRFTYTIQPLGKTARPRMRFAAGFRGIDLAAMTDFERLNGLRFAGTASGDDIVLEWPSGRFSALRGGGRVAVTPPTGAPPMAQPFDELNPTGAPPAGSALALAEWGPFAPVPLPQHLPIAGDVSFRFDPDQVYIDAGRFATDRTHVTFQGSTAWGDQSRIAFHATSRDWQESDQVLAGIMTAFGAPRRPVTFGGRGEFAGTLIGAFRAPRVEGEFSGDELRGFDTRWGSGRAHILVENDYVRVTDGRVTSDGSEMHFDGLFSLGFPREDHGNEIDARIRVVGRDIDSLRHAFGIDEYPIAGSLSGDFHLTGDYTRPIGFGAMTLDRFHAYGEPFQTATASLRFDGMGVRLDGVAVEKDGGSITGAAFVGWDATYSFNVDGQRIPVEKIGRLRFDRAPLSGIAEFSATGSATFDQPRNDYRIRVNDLFVGDEGVGQVTATLALRGTDLSGDIDAASPRLALTATGHVALTPRGDSELAVRFHDVSVDPYVRPFVPRLSPLTAVTASGFVRVAGQLADMDHLRVEGTVDALDMKLADYAERPIILRNAVPVRLSLTNGQVNIDELRMTGEDTELRLSGAVDISGQRIALRASGDANLAILQTFFKDVRGSGRAALAAAADGALREPVLSGRATINNGRIRHFSLPSSLDAINGVISFDARGIRFDEVSATMGGGTVQFGGRIGLDGYQLGDLNVTMRGSGVQLRLIEGLRSVVDADLALRGNVKAPTLGGSVVVKDGLYTKSIDAPETILDFALRRPAAAGSPVTSEVAVPTTVPLRYDVAIVVPSTMRIDNNLGQGRASADLTLRGTFDRPVFFGHAEVERGVLNYKGKRYRLTKGTVDFTNPTRIEPFFDIEAETNVRVERQNYRLTVGVSGATQKLVPSLTSDPPLPAADILALLFSDVRRTGDVELRSLQNPTQRQNDLLSANAAEAISKPISEASKIVQRTFGVDTFQLTPFLTDVNSTQASRLNPTARLTIGKRISDRVYLTFSRSLASAINDQIIMLEYDADERVSWMLSRNEESQTYALEFRVRRSY